MSEIQKYRIHYQVRDAATRKLIKEDHHDGTYLLEEAQDHLRVFTAGTSTDTLLKAWLEPAEKAKGPSNFSRMINAWFAEHRRNRYDRC